MSLALISIISSFETMEIDGLVDCSSERLSRSEFEGDPGVEEFNVALVDGSYEVSQISSMIVKT